MSTRKTITAALLALTVLGGMAGRADALNKAGGGGSCVRYVYYTNANGWPDYKCVSYLYGR